MKRKGRVIMEENTGTRIDPATAYVKSMDYLDKVIAEAELTSKKISKYRIGCAAVSVVLGALLAWSFGNIFGFLAPVAGLNATFYLYSRSVLKRLQGTIANAKYDKDRLKGGKIDPRYFYERCAEALREAKSFAYLENLNGDTSKLTVKEKTMLSRFLSE